MNFVQIPAESSRESRCQSFGTCNSGRLALFATSSWLAYETCQILLSRAVKKGYNGCRLAYSGARKEEEGYSLYPAHRVHGMVTKDVHMRAKV